MRCVFPACGYVAGHATSGNITLFRFPEEPSLRIAWLEALGKVGWDLESDSAVCSKHFLNEDFLITRNRKKLRNDAVPVNVQMCRICFARDCKLCLLKDDKQPDLSRPSFAYAYETLTGLSLEQEENLPPYLCVQCANQLLKCVRFKASAIRAQYILLDVIHDYGHITLDAIQAVKRFHNPHSSDILIHETDSDNIESDNACIGEQDLEKENFTYNIKVESVDIVDHEVVVPDKRSNEKSNLCNLQNSPTVKAVKTENYNITEGAIGDSTTISVQENIPDVENNHTIIEIPTDKELNETDANRELYIDAKQTCNDNIKSNKDNVSLESSKDIIISRQSNEDKINNIESTIINSIDIEDLFDGKDCSLNGILPSETAIQEHNLSPTELKAITEMPKKLIKGSNKQKEKGNGGLLLSFKLLSCDICNYKTVSNVQLGYHLKVHAAAKTYKCTMCNFLTNSKKTLKFHTEIICIKKHTCSVCKKKFLSKSDLKIHMRTHSGDKPFSCTSCHKKFCQYSQLTAHLRIHTGEKPFSCDVCKKAFRQKGQLQNHSRIHSGEKPYSCELCRKSFIQRGELQNHLQTHAKEKLYCCDICNKSFYLKGRLQNHMRIHTKLKK